MKSKNVYLVQAHHVAETSVISGDQVLWKKSILPWGSLDLDLLLRLREIAHEPQNDPPHCQRGLVTAVQNLMKSQEQKSRTPEMINTGGIGELPEHLLHPRGRGAAD